jgi:hypothetical protein
MHFGRQSRIARDLIDAIEVHADRYGDHMRRASVRAHHAAGRVQA